MRTAGRIKEYSHSHITIEIDADKRIFDQLDKLDGVVIVELRKYREKRSKSANNYFWDLVSQISVRLGSDRDSVYKWLLRDAGVMVSLLVVEDAIETLEKTFRVVDVIGIQGDMIEVNCYYGSSTYDTKEMAHLLDVTIEEAKRLGCDVWSEDEVRKLYETDRDNKTTS